MKLVPVTEDVYACLQEGEGTGYSNSGFVNLGSGLVVDSFFDLPHTRDLIALYAGVWRRSPATLVNTHHNGDHCWGNQLFRDCQIIGHRSCRDLMAADRPEELQAVARGKVQDPRLADLAERLSDFDFSGIELTPPTRVFDDKLTLHDCDTPIELRYVGPAHTASDVIVFLPEKGVLFAGDIVFRQCTPMGWDGSYAQWLAALDAIVDLAPQVVVPGHGPICGIDGVEEMRSYLQYVRREAWQQFEAGRTALEAAKHIDLGPYANWSEPDRLVFNIERAYAEFRNQPVSDRNDLLRWFGDMQALRRFWGTAEGRARLALGTAATASSSTAAT